ncbi:Alpha/Beta hydrolase protein [Aspergillus carlsbadensis]|nr:Alpha/Beta hydrolase protein [Aspergillus carlsbadensis]
MRMIGSENPEAVFQAPRFRNTKAQLGIPVSTDQFSAYWLVKQPSDSLTSGRRRIVLLWIHGGAYIGGDAFAGLGSLLRVAELATDQGIDLDIFSLEYTLAPKAKFPVQQQQAVSAYRHLVEEAHVDPGCLIVGGESAGGHLAIACLQGIARANMPRPSASLLLCPWVNMTNTANSFQRNKYNDILVKDSLDGCVTLALGPDATQDKRNLLNFAVPSTGDLQWANILPARTWMNVGSHDLFFDDIIAFQKIIAGEAIDIELTISDAKTHGWQSVTDHLCSKTYYNLAPGETLPPDCMPGGANIMSGLSWLLGSE